LIMKRARRGSVAADGSCVPTKDDWVLVKNEDGRPPRRTRRGTEPSGAVKALKAPKTDLSSTSLLGRLEMVSLAATPFEAEVQKFAPIVLNNTEQCERSAI
jgi:hypothetical protein